ncbi:MAG: hypothetical protein SFY92_09335 [Verrucomicrobiae bacterium]|nr:hypothetical protein [Verrucomicrobiae bacterium]
MWQNGFNNGLGNLMMLSNAKTRSITAENVYGEKGGGARAEWRDEAPPGVLEIGQRWDGKTGHANCASELGRGWKVRPCITLEPGKETTLMDVDGPGVIQHLWMTIEEKFFIMELSSPLTVPVFSGWRRKSGNVSSQGAWPLRGE